MDNLIKLLDKKKGNIIISSNSLFEELFRGTLKESFLYDITFKSFVDLMHDTMGGYDIEAEYKLYKELDITIEGACQYLDSYMIGDFKYKDLVEEYKVNPYGLDTYKNKNIIIVTPRIITPLINKALILLKEYRSDLKYLSFDEATLKNHYLYEYNTIIDEVENSAEIIASLIDNGTPIDKIKIEIESDSYKKYIDDIFPFYGIEYFYDERKHLSEFEDVNKFYETVLYRSRIDPDTYDFNSKIVDIYSSEFELPQDIKKSLTTLLMGWDSMDKDYFKYLISSVSIPMPKYSGAVMISSNILERVIKDDEYIFIFGANQSSFPKTVDPNGLLTDEVLTKYNLMDKKELNTKVEEYLINKIKTISNLYISYKLKDEASSYLKASILDRIDSLVIKKIEKSNTRYSLKRDLIKFLKADDLYRKYGAITDDYKDFYVLGSNASFMRDSFDTSFIVNKKDELRDFMNNTISMSYSSFDTYNECPEKYFFDKVLVVNPYEQTYGGYLGSFMHLVLENFIDKEYDQVEVDLLYEEYRKNQLEKNHYSLSLDEDYFFKKFYDAIPLITKTIQDKLKKYPHSSIEKEKKFNVYKKINGFKIRINGTIDLLIKDKDNNITIVDYKTGSYHNPNFEDGKGLQLLIYFIYYNASEGGIYHPFGLIYQAIDKSLEKEPYVKNSGMYLDSSLSESIDSKSSFLPTKKKSKEEFDEMFKLTEEYFNGATTKVSLFDFEATPSSDACKYCSYKNLCNKKSVINDENKEEEDNLNGNDQDPAKSN